MPTVNNELAGMFEETVVASARRDRETSGQPDSEFEPGTTEREVDALPLCQPARPDTFLCENTLHDLLYLSISSSWNTKCEPLLDFPCKQSLTRVAKYLAIESRQLHCEYLQCIMPIASGLKFVLSVIFTLLLSEHFLCLGYEKEELTPLRVFHNKLL
jgi:hypothetical protein